MLTIAAITAGFIGVVAIVGLGFVLASGGRTLIFVARLLPVLHPRSVGSATRRRGDPVVVRGKVTPVDTITSPHTGREGVYIKALVETWQSSTTSLPSSGGGWIVSERLEEAAPFELRGEESTILVDPEGGRFLLRAKRHSFDDRTRCVTESVIEPDQELVVIGKIADEEGFEPSMGYRGTTVRPVMSSGAGGLLVATPWGLTRDIARRLSFVTLGGSLALAILFGVLLFFGNHYPSITYSLPGEAVMSAHRDTERYRGAVHLWRSQVPRGAEVIGEARIETWVLGAAVRDPRLDWLVGQGASSLAFTRACDAFWAHQLNGMSPYREESRREYLIFEVITWSGTAFREPEVWERICGEIPWCCPSLPADS